MRPPRPHFPSRPPPLFSPQLRLSPLLRRSPATTIIPTRVVTGRAQPKPLGRHPPPRQRFSPWQHGGASVFLRAVSSTDVALAIHPGTYTLSIPNASRQENGGHTGDHKGLLVGTGSF